MVKLSLPQVKCSVHEMVELHHGKGEITSACSGRQACRPSQPGKVKTKLLPASEAEAGQAHISNIGITLLVFNTSTDQNDVWGALADG